MSLCGIYRRAVNLYQLKAIELFSIFELSNYFEGTPKAFLYTQMSNIKASEPLMLKLIKAVARGNTTE